MKLRLPHPFVLLLCAVAVAALLTWLIPAGEYQGRTDEATGREVLRLLRLTDRCRSLAPFVLSGAERNVAQERHLIEALGSRDREKLLRLFEKDRSRIEQQLLAGLQSRNL